MSQPVLVPVLPTALDPGRVTHCAVPYGRAIAARHGAPLVLVSVVGLSDSLRSFLAVEGEQAEELARGWAAEREEALHRLAQAITGVRVKIEVRVGEPAAQIAALADEYEARVVAMTSHARAGIARVLAGSVTIGVVRQAGCPVLVVRPTSPAPAANAAVTLTPVLVPLDGSSLAEEALDAVIRVLGTHELGIHLIHVLRSESADRDWERYLRSLAEQLTAKGISPTWSLRRGSVVDAIAEAAAESSAGLIAMTTRGASGVRERLFGSTAENVLRTVRLPSLLIHARPEERREAGATGTMSQLSLDVHSLTLRARDLMTSPAITVSPDDTLEHVARTMLEHGISAVPVVDADGRLLGIISEHDLMAQEQGLPFSVYRAPQLFGHWLPPEGLEELYRLGRSLEAKTVMRHPVVTVSEDATATQIAQLMIETGHTHVPVIRDGRVIGMITRHDLLKLLAGSSQSSL